MRKILGNEWETGMILLTIGAFPKGVAERVSSFLFNQKSVQPDTLGRGGIISLRSAHVVTLMRGAGGACVSAAVRPDARADESRSYTTPCTSPSDINRKGAGLGLGHSSEKSDEWHPIKSQDYYQPLLISICSDAILLARVTCTPNMEGVFEASLKYLGYQC